MIVMKGLLIGERWTMMVMKGLLTGELWTMMVVKRLLTVRTHNTGHQRVFGTGMFRRRLDDQALGQLTLAASAVHRVVRLGRLVAPEVVRLQIVFVCSLPELL